MPKRTRVLFFAEAVTLAHVSRPYVLIKGLDNNQYDIGLACAAGSERILRDSSLRCLPLTSIPGATFLQRLATGQPLYTEADLERYVAADLQLIERFQPDIVVGDFRLSLAVSAPTAGVPYVSICNAHWSPYVKEQRVPAPEIPLTRILGPKIGQYLFDLARPIAFAQHARPMNRLRKRFGLPPFEGLRHVYTEADLSLYADPPALIPTRGLPPHHRFIGPILWEPDTVQPDWWDVPSDDQPLIYVTLGSSGQTRLLPLLGEILAALPV